MKKTASFFCALFILIHSLAGAEELPPLPPGPLILTSVTPEQLSPEFWINRLPEPDRVLKTPAQLAALNRDIYAMVRNVVDVFKIGNSKSGRPVRDQIELEFKTLRNRVLYAVDNSRVPKSLFDETIRPEIQTDKIPSTIKIKYGVAARSTSVRALPSDVKMLEKPDDIEFDQLQFTRIKLWTPVAVYHRSKSGKWMYVQATYTRGWVKAADIVVATNPENIKKHVKSERFLVVTAESVPVFSDAAFQKFNQKASMGTILPLAAKTAKAYEIFLPVRTADGTFGTKKGYINLKSDVRTKFPAFTQRNIITQAFKLLGARYGWGGTYDGRDCSGFTQDVFLSMGVNMPRGSKDQTFVGTQLGHFEYKENAAEKNAVLKEAVPGITLMRMPHHMMIYLGEYNGQFYAIHSTWAERYSMTSDAKNRINQVVVSDLTLNGRSHLGDLFARIISMSEVN
jgi:cell wall-associated NlpC family hydrolase